MKKTLYLSAGFFLTMASPAVALDFSQTRHCEMVRYTSAPYFQSERPAVGSVAYTRGQDGQFRLITLQDLIDDRMIHFRQPSGSMTQEYFWLYSPASAIPEARLLGVWKFFSQSVVGDTIITISDRGGRASVQYANTDTGHMLDLSCSEK